MSITTNARGRAEEMLQTLQKRARDLLDAEEGLAKTVRDLIEHGLPLAEVRKSLEELIGRVGANKVLARRFDTSIHWVLSNLQIATTDDLHRMRDDVDALRTRLDGMDERLSAPKRATRQPEN